MFRTARVVRNEMRTGANGSDNLNFSKEKEGGKGGIKSEDVNDSVSYFEVLLILALSCSGVWVPTLLRYLKELQFF